MMKSWIKGILITVASLLLLAVIAVTVLIHGIFSPARLTPVVNEVADSLLVVPHRLDRVELTFWSTFPNFGLEIENLCILNPMEGAPSDTLANIPSLTIALNVQSLRQKRLAIDEVQLKDATANIYINADGKTNMEIVNLSPDTASADTEAVVLPFNINLDRLKLSFRNASFVDEADSLYFSQVSLDIDIRAKMDTDFNPIEADIRKFHLRWQDLQADLSGTAALADSLTVHLERSDIRLDSLSVRLEGDWGMSMADYGMQTDVRLSLDDWTLGRIWHACGLPLWHSVPSLGRTMDSLPSLLPDSLSVETALRGDVHVYGPLDSVRLPVADVSVRLDGLKAHYALSQVPYYVEDGVIGLSANADLMHPRRCKVQLERLDAVVRSLYYSETDNPLTLSLDGELSDIFPKDNWEHFNPVVSFRLRTAVDLQEANPYVTPLLDSVIPMLPDITYTVHKTWLPNGQSTKRAKEALERFEKNGFPKNTASVGGRLSLDVDCRGNRLNYWTALDLKHIKGTVDLQVRDISINLLDGYSVGINRIGVDLKSPVSDSVRTAIWQIGGKMGKERPESLVTYDYKLNVDDISVALPDLRVGVPGVTMHYMGEFNPDISDTEIETWLADLCVQDMRLNIDTEAIWIKQPSISILYRGQDANPNKCQWTYKIATDSLRYTMQSGYETIVSGPLCYTLTEKEQEDTSSYFLHWLPVGRLTFSNFTWQSPDMDFKANLPMLDVTLQEQNYTVNRSRIVIGNSDFSLTGTVRQVGLWQAHKDKLIADLKFASDYTDVDELINTARGMLALRVLYGYETDSDEKTDNNANTASVDTAQETAGDDTPIVLPTDIDFALNADIGRCRVFRQDASDLHAGVFLHNGTVMLQDVAFNSDAAKLHLTARLDAPVPEGKMLPDSVSLGFNFDMRDIRIAKVIDIIPKVDSVMPMLRTFDGKVNLNLAYSVVSDSLGNILPHRSNAALALSGKDLRVVPNDIFKKIAKLLVFKDKNKNSIDSLYAEAKMINDTVLVYPFVVMLDKVMVAIGGSNKLNAAGNLASVDYHASLIKPLVAGIDIKGPMDSLDFKLVLPKYTGTFKPVRYYDAATQASTIEAEIDGAVEMFLKAIK